MTMTLQSLTISLKKPYSKPGPQNPYQAKLDVSYNDNRMTVALSQDTCMRVLELAGHEIAQAAQVQIADFVRTAISIAHQDTVEAKAIAKDQHNG